MAQMNVDSLWNVYRSAKSDSAKIRLRFEIANESYDMSIPLWDSIITASKKYPEMSSITTQAYNNRGFIYDINGESDKAVDSYESSMEIAIEQNDLLGECLALHNISACYQQIGEYEKALSYSFQCLKIAEKNQFDDYIAAAYNTHAVCYHYMGLPDLAIDYYNRAVDGNLKLGKQGEYDIAVCYTNIGSVFYDLDQVDEALDYYRKSLKISESLNHYDGLNQSLTNKNNIAMILATQGKNEDAIKMFLRNAEVYDSISDPHGVGLSYSNLAGIYNDENKHTLALEYARKSVANLNKSFPFELSESYSVLSNVFIKLDQTDSAMFYAEKAHDIAIKLNSNDLKSRTNKTLYEIFKSIGNYKKALNHFELMREAELSIINDKSKNKILEQKFRLEYLEQSISDSLKNQQRRERDSLALMASEAQTLKIKAEKDKLSLASKYDRIRLIGAIIIAACILIIAFVLFRRFKVEREQKQMVQKQKSTIENQHLQLESVHKEISDSINYAQHLQEAILPSREELKKVFPESFIFFKPKDVVSGDFYWLFEDQNAINFAVADCTGHGVPGAMVSIVCSEALNRSIIELNASDTDKILDETKKLVSSTFSKSGKMLRDGMDVSLIKYDKKTKRLSFSGANNPIYLVSKSPQKVGLKSIADNGTMFLYEFKANKQSIGFSASTINFDSAEIPIESGDLIYMFSDGYADQFGGKDSIAGKKLKYKNFKRILLDSSEFPIDQQKSAVEIAFNDWKGTFEQLDDVTVVGIKF